MKVLKLRGQADRRLRSGHVWIFSNEVDIKSTPLVDFTAGEVVHIESAQGKFLGVAMVNPHALICARVFSRNKKVGLSKNFLIDRITAAMDLRERAFSDQSYRLVYGDSDGLPGLVIDRFGGTCVVQISTAGMELHKDIVLAALLKVVKPDAVIFKNDGKMRESEGLSSYVEVVHGDPGEWLSLTENGVKFQVPTTGGQKTGWFYDHRLNRARLKDYVQGKRVLDLFSYAGGWGVQAACFGAESVVAVDSSELALNMLMKNAALNGVQEKVQTIQGDVFNVLKAMLDSEQRFDVVIADPPAFIPRRKDLKSGEQAYSRLNQQALRLLEHDGILVSASCSMHLSTEKLVDIVRSAGRHVDRNMQVLEVGAQGADHPVLPAVPETSYLKAIFVRSMLPW
ncbi:MAG: class I SAM-dependent rRNA methyltransferase [Hahellaceae bacterium]|nr:class I SAM-dependent rRNA methyltransferase [Hahellaceae bacterium]MCP5210576.1 class I SAM-dependent rRNA methyltransferase [Hahellaceae bacterium]